MIFLLTKLYSYLHEFFHTNFDFNIPGLGFILRKNRKPRILKIKNKLMYFNPKIADSYERLINGRFNEPETHKFLNRILELCSNDCIQFIDVGGNIGEFPLDLGSNKKLEKLIIFEPLEDCAVVILISMLLNGFSNVKVIKKAVTNEVGFVRFKINKKGISGSGITENILDNFKLLQSTTLDLELEKDNKPKILLIDVEGAELKVIKGGIEFIKLCKPLIIFEYNYITQRYFSLSNFKLELPEGYTIFRLRSDGLLDKSFKKIWNLVAVHNESIFYNLCIQSTININV